MILKIGREKGCDLGIDFFARMSMQKVRARKYWWLVAMERDMGEG